MKEQILAVQRMQDYIGSHLEQELTLPFLTATMILIIILPVIYTLLWKQKGDKIRREILNAKINRKPSE